MLVAYSGWLFVCDPCGTCRCHELWSLLLCCLLRLLMASGSSGSASNVKVEPDHDAQDSYQDAMASGSRLPIPIEVRRPQASGTPGGKLHPIGASPSQEFTIDMERDDHESAEQFSKCLTAFSRYDKSDQGIRYQWAHDWKAFLANVEDIRPRICGHAALKHLYEHLTPAEREEQFYVDLDHICHLDEHTSFSLQGNILITICSRLIEKKSAPLNHCATRNAQGHCV